MGSEQDFFSSRHKRLLNAAAWSKHLAWIALVIELLCAAGAYLQEQVGFRMMISGSGFFSERDFLHYLIAEPAYGFGVLTRLATIVLTGIALFLILKGVSLGLNMIVETDINYREARKAKAGDE